MKSDQWNIKETNCVQQTQNAGKVYNEFQYVADGKTSLIKTDLSILISNVGFVSVRAIVLMWKYESHCMIISERFTPARLNSSS